MSTEEEIERIIKGIGNINDTDKLEVSHGFSRGNYASAYETEDYEVARDAVDGNTGFYRIAHMLGFFSSYELHEIHDEEIRMEVEHYRAVFKIMFPWIAW